MEAKVKGDPLPYADELKAVEGDMLKVPFLGKQYRELVRKKMILQTARARAKRDLSEVAKMKKVLNG